MPEEIPLWVEAPEPHWKEVRRVSESPPWTILAKPRFVDPILKFTYVDLGYAARWEYGIKNLGKMGIIHIYLKVTPPDLDFSLLTRPERRALYTKVSMAAGEYRREKLWVKIPKEWPWDAIIKVEQTIEWREPYGYSRDYNMFYVKPRILFISGPTDFRVFTVQLYKVTDYTGKPIEGVFIGVYDRNWKRLFYRRSKKDGTFSLKIYKEGIYYLYAKKKYERSKPLVLTVRGPRII